MELIALAVSPIESVNGVREMLQATYPMLSDVDHEAAEAFGVFNLLGDGVAAPSVFIIESDGRIVWSYVGRSSADRPEIWLILDNLP